MNRRRTLGFSALAVFLLVALAFVSSGDARVSRISRSAFLLPKKALSLAPAVVKSAMLAHPGKQAAGESGGSAGIISGVSYSNDVSPPLRDLPAAPIELAKEREANENPGIPPHHKDSSDAAVQASHFSPEAGMPAPILNFNGIPFPGVSCNCAPPDTDGEVGLTQYVQIVNEGYQVFNKATGASVFGPVGIATIWSGFGGLCETSGHGDPVVLYDQLADRWLVSQFAGSPPTDECVAVSTSSDAAGSYNRYAFHLGTNFFDYPHLGVWPDAYYMSMNVFNSGGTAFLGPQPFAFDRTAMLAGLPAAFVSPGITGGPSEDAYLPSDLDGSTLPPAGAPNSFVEFPGTGVYRVYHFHADFAVPANSTFTLFASPPAAGFTQLCSTTRACVPQLGSADRLDGIGDRFMFRLAYRNFGDHEAVVTNYSVLSGGVAGVRWIELRNLTAGPVTVFQESTYQPDSDWRWMGSAAMDFQGNLALGFSASSSAISPQIRYAGRLAGDPLNTLAQGEAHLFDGTGSQTGTGNRWGDYSALTVDPVDDCTFWYTQEYYAVTGAFNWRTRIGNFKFPGCALPTPTPTITGTRTATPTPTNTPTPSPTACVTTATPLNEGFESGTLGAFTSAVPTCVPGGCGWSAATSDKHSGSFAAFAPDPNNISDQQLATSSGFAVPSGASSAVLSFWHRVATEATFDGGVLEFSTDNGATWSSSVPNFISGGYNGTISTQYGSPISGRAAWTGTIGSPGAFAQVQVNLMGFAGQSSLRFRFRLASDNSVSSTGWWVDDVAVTIGTPCSGTPTATPTLFPPDPTVTNTRTSTPTSTRTQTPTRTPTNTRTSTPIRTPTRTPTNTRTSTPTRTPTNTPTNTATNTPTNTPTRASTNTPTISPTPTNTPTNTPTQTPTNTPANTPTSAPTNTPTQTPTNVPTNTPSNTPTNTPTPGVSGIAFVKNVGTASHGTGFFGTLQLTVPPAGVAAGNSLVISIYAGSSTVTFACSDSKSNAYSQNVAAGGGGIPRSAIVSAHSVAALVSGDTITCTFATSSTGSGMSVNEFSGLSPVPLDGTASVSGTNSSPNSGLTASTIQTNELVFGFVHSVAFTPAASGSNPVEVYADPPNSDPYHSAGQFGSVWPVYRIVSTTRQYQANGTGGGTGGWRAMIATFKGAF